MKVLAGDFKTGTARIKLTWMNKPSHLAMPAGMFKSERVELSAIATVRPLAENGVDWGAAAMGAVAFGPAGLLAGLGGAGRKVLALEFKDGRRAMVECDGDELKILLAAVF
jgi:hypothetical protein